LYPQLYPGGLRCFRFNDAVFLGIDGMNLEPPSNRISLTGGYTIAELRREWSDNGEQIALGTKRESAGGVAKFLGLVARVHDYVNAREADKSLRLPNCGSLGTSAMLRRQAGERGLFLSESGGLSCIQSPGVGL
jgi:hypothetical protein